MGRTRAKQPKVPLPKRQRGKSTWRLAQSIRTALRAHPKWPELRVSDWQPLARVEWGLDENLGARDPRYDLIHQFCKNERNRRKRSQAMVL